MAVLCMKLIVYLTGLALMVAVAGCEWHEHEHGQYQGGAYDGNYQGSGYQTYPGPAYPHDREYWEHHRDYRY